MAVRTGFAIVLLVALPALAPAEVRVAPDPGAAAAATPAPLAIGGRTADVDGGLAYQWPGVYFETAVDGGEVLFDLRSGPSTLHVLVDGEPVTTLRAPAAGRYRVSGMAPGRHQVRLETASEHQAAPNVFGGFLLADGSTPAPLPRRHRRIEFIGDSHTVGYANTSNTRECSAEQVDASTDTAAAFGPRVARHYGADYRIHAISGRGVVRNYNGGPGDTLPRAWPRRLPSHDAAEVDTGWQPQVVVVALGTNDFSTPLRPGEPWADRDALRADYVRHYAGFVRTLRSRWPQAPVVLWATDMAGGEIQLHARQVVQLLGDGGDRAVSFLPVSGLDLQACHWHPSAADHAAIAAALVAHIDALPAPWPQVDAAD